jgi:hypothetical protein
LIKREPDATDTRDKFFIMTHKGYQILVKSVQIGDNINNDFFGVLGQQVSDFNSRLQSL